MKNVINVIMVFALSAIIWLLYKQQQQLNDLASEQETVSGASLPKPEASTGSSSKTPVQKPQSTKPGSIKPQPQGTATIVKSIGDLNVEWTALDPTKKKPKPLKRLDVHRNRWQETVVNINLSESQRDMLKGRTLSLVIKEEGKIRIVNDVLVGNSGALQSSLVDHEEKTGSQYVLEINLGQKNLFSEEIVKDRRFTR